MKIPPSADMKRACKAANFELAWQRLLKSGEPFYKWHWRGLAAAASLADESLRKRLRNDLRHRKFDPHNVCLISVPKATGLLRHFAVLSFGDLLTYQAIMNVVADKAYPKLRDRYLSSVFGNLYAGPDEPYFYVKWQHCYDRFNRASESAFRNGYAWFAEYDFASFYDSICHGTLSTILTGRFGVSGDLVASLCDLLKRWTAGDGRPASIERHYLDHGIPQGPWPSAFLAEVVLSYIDDHMLRTKNIVYLRYADDIRLFAKDERSARAAAVKLDRLARNIGIFPQTSKFSIRRLIDVHDILKRVPSPGLGYGAATAVRQQGVLQELLQLTTSADFENTTLFKYLIAQAPPDRALADRVVQLVITRPELADHVCRYLERMLPLSDFAIGVLMSVLHQSPYSWLLARVLRLLTKPAMGLKKRDWRGLEKWLRGMLKHGPSWWDAVLSSEVYLAATERGLVSSAEVQAWLQDPATEWWAITRFLMEADASALGTATLTGLLESSLSTGSRDVERIAAFRLARYRSVMPNVSMHPDVRAIFIAAGLAKRPYARYSRIGHLLTWLLRSAKALQPSAEIPPVDWHRMAGSFHEVLEQYCVGLLGHYGPNRNMFVMELDAMMDRVVQAIQEQKTYPVPRRKNVRAYLIRSSPEFRRDFPKLAAFCSAANDLRGRCEQTHAIHTATGTAIRTGRVYFADVEKLLQQMTPALLELSAAYPG